MLQVGEEFISGLSLGGNPKAIKMLLAFKNVIIDYDKPAGKVLRNDLAITLKKYEEFLYLIIISNK